MKTTPNSEQLQLINSVADISPVARISDIYPDLRMQIETSICAVNEQKDAIINLLIDLKQQIGSNVVTALNTAVSDKLSAETDYAEFDDAIDDREPFFNKKTIRNLSEGVYDLTLISSTMVQCLEALERIAIFEKRINLAKNGVLL